MTDRTDAVRPLWISIICVFAILSACMLRPGGIGGIDKLTYHHNSQRTGWNDHEATLSPKAVAGASFGLLWQTPTLDYFEGVPPRLFASPLYVDAVKFSTDRYQGRTFAAVFAVTTTGYVYAVNAREAGDTPPGAILWRTRLTDTPCDRGTSGNLSTPIIDLPTRRLYVTSCANKRWQAHAIDIQSGDEIQGWPIEIGDEAINVPGINRNGSAQFFSKNMSIQRGALNLSQNRSRLYVTFSVNDGGWIVAVDVNRARVVSAFSSTSITAENQGGMWASGGPSIDQDGRVYMATGASYFHAVSNEGFAGVFPDSSHSWGQSILQWRDTPESEFDLLGTYTPFNYCQTGSNDVDLGSSGTVVIDLDPKVTSTPHLLALGGAKEGNVYLLDRAHMPGGVTKRHPCSSDSATDLSLLPPENQPQFGKRGPVNVFGPYTDEQGKLDQARSRSTLAYFHAATGEDYLYATGSSKKENGSSESVPPGLVKLKVVTSPGEPAYLRIDQQELTQTLQNAGSPIVTSSGGKNAIVWVLDTNTPRSATLYGTHAAQPVLYAFDAIDLKLIWKSAPGVLFPGGKYNEPAVVNGVVYVGTDRIQAFGLRPSPPQRALSFTPLFDGETLNHWHGDPAVWFVKDGAITGQIKTPSSKNTSLIHDGAFRDFEIHFKYRFLTAQGSSGMQYRSHPYAEHEYEVAGYQANVATLDAKERFAMLSDEDSRGDLSLLGEKADVFYRNGKLQSKILGLVNPRASIYAAVRPYPEWNDYVVIAYGNRFVHAVNGLLALDVQDNDFEGRASDGAFALQIHWGPPTEVQFKDIEVKELISPPDFTGPFETHPAPSPSKLSTGDAKVVQMGKNVYEQRCARCHSAKQSGAPPQESLAQFPHERIANALVSGRMQDMALGLGDEEIQAVATYLTSPVATQ
jgi:Domain of Unknown Function (DUF1080)/Cytochrome C oxidase, cbb3-type, subunit III